MPNRIANDRLRGGRKHLTEPEVERLVKAAKRRGRHGHRDATAIMLCYRHGLRVSELVGLQWTQFNLDRGTFEVRRLKGGDPSTHYMNGAELRGLRQLRRENDKSRYLFIGERGNPAEPAWFRSVVYRAAAAAKLSFPVNPHMLRHSIGYTLANQGKDTRAIQAFLGHRNIQSTTVYTKMSPDRFKGWEDDIGVSV
jgi:type 1 fimbriae regulatory protein FimB/type 1 fimbriae regulatory protein FimE